MQSFAERKPEQTGRIADRMKLDSKYHRDLLIDTAGTIRGFA